jgi:hypothetical protein
VRGSGRDSGTKREVEEWKEDGTVKGREGEEEDTCKTRRKKQARTERKGGQAGTGMKGRQAVTKRKGRKNVV